MYVIYNLKFIFDKTNLIQNKFHYGSIFDFISVILFIGFFFFLRSLFKNICNNNFNSKRNLLYTKLIGLTLILTQINEYIWYYFKIDHFINSINLNGVNFKYQLTVNPMILITGFLFLITPFIYEKTYKNDRKTEE